MQRRSWLMFAGLFALTVLPRVVSAHAGHDPVDGGLVDGFLHPLTGWDHLIAMIAIGVWAAQAGGRAVVALPLVFVSMMLVGGAVALAGVKLPLIEPGIIASVLVLGLLIAAAARLSLVAGVVITALFALVHGAAHGQELGDAAPAGFAPGALLASALLHIIGATLGAMMKAKLGDIPVRLAGGVVAAAGLLMILGVL